MSQEHERVLLVVIVDLYFDDEDAWLDRTQRTRIISARKATTHEQRTYAQAR